MSYTKKRSPIAREDFKRHALPLEATIAGIEMSIPLKEYSTGSFGWHQVGKLAIEVNGIELPVQMGLTFTVIGSRND